MHEHTGWQKWSVSGFVPVFFVAVFLSATLIGVSSNAFTAEKDQHVVIISIDGLAAYLLDDPKAPIHTIRQLAREGAFVKSGLKVSNPSVTWPNHTSLVTGVHPEKHGVLANGVLVRGAEGVPVIIDSHKDQRDLVRVPTLCDIAHAAGLKTGEVNWPCTRGSKSFDDSFPDVPDAVKHSTPRFREELISAGILKDDTDKTFKSDSIVSRDATWTAAACYLIRQRMPNLLLLHLLNVDATHHSRGAQSQEGYTANAYADACVAQVLRALDDAGVREKTTIFIVADHGFTRTTKAIRPNVLLREAGLLSLGPKPRIVDARVNVVPEGGIGLVYCNHRGDVDADRKRVQAMFQELEGVAGILTPDQFAEHGMPHPREYAQSPDLILVAKDGYGVSGSAEGETFVTSQEAGRISLGSHGFLATYPRMNALCVLSGRGIRRGAIVPTAENISIAPTAAKLLGLENYQADGKPLNTLLEEAR